MMTKELKGPFDASTGCDFCGRELEHNPGDFYHRSDCGKRYIREAITRETDPITIKRLKAWLKRVSYVGD